MAEATEWMEYPIWQDRNIEIPMINHEKVAYRLKIKDDIIYNGYAYGVDNNAVIRVNKILANYISNTIDFDITGYAQDNNAYVTAKLEISYDEWGSVVDFMNIRVYYDYSYTYDERFILADPITKVLDRRQMFVCSFLNNYSSNESSPATLYKDGKKLGDYSVSNGIFTIVRDLDTVGDEYKVTLDNGESITYKVKDTCKPYCLYYLNSRGGWDSMIFDGKIVQGASLTINQYKAEYDNTTRDFNVVDYLKLKTDKWKLTTGYLTDAQSQKIYNIYDTTKAYLHVLGTDTIIPVNVTDNSYDVKTYSNQGRKLFTYTINIQASQTKEIR